MRVGAFSNLVAISETRLLKQVVLTVVVKRRNGRVFRSNEAKRANLKICFAGPAGTSLLKTRRPRV